MAEPLPQRLAGYGAYNLAFDNMLGRRQPNGPDYIKIIRNQFGLRNINLVRVICFRYSRTEGLPAARATPLYATKNTYPNGGRDDAGQLLDFNGPVLRALDEAARTTSFPSSADEILSAEPDAG